MDELRPVIKELTLQPIAFVGGLVSGFLRLDPGQDPLRSWLQNQNIALPKASASSDRPADGKPQSISID
jgi:hypothetical protein